MLVKHRIDDVYERLIAVEQTVPATQDITLQPPFDGMLAQHLHHASIRRELAAVSVLWEILCQPDLLGDLVNSFESVGLGFIWPEDAKAVHVPPHHFPQEIAERRDVPGQSCAGFFDFDRRVPKIGELQGLANKTAISDRVCTHPPISRGSQSLQLGDQAAFTIE